MVWITLGLKFGYGVPLEQFQGRLLEETAFVVTNPPIAGRDRE